MTVCRDAVSGSLLIPFSINLVDTLAGKYVHVREATRTIWQGCVVHQTLSTVALFEKRRAESELIKSVIFFLRRGKRRFAKVEDLD